MAAKPVKVAYVADTADLRSSLAKAEAAMEATGDTAKSAGAKIDSAFDSTAESADQVASKGSQAAGALAGLGGLVGGSFGAAMTTGGTALQAFADAGDLVNVVTESAIVRKIKDTAVTVGQTAAHVAAAVATTAQAAATWALNAAIAVLTSPITLVVAAIAVLVGGLILAYKKSETFRNIVNGAFGAVKAAGVAMWDGLQAAFDGIKNAISSIGSFASNMKSKVTGAFGDVVDFIKGVPGKITALGGKFKDAGSAVMNKIIDGIKSAAGFISGIASSIWNAVKGLLNGAIDKINGALEFTVHIPAAPDVHINAPNIPHLARGGITTGPTVAMIGDNPGGREAVIPLDKYDLSGNQLVAALSSILAELKAQALDQARYHRESQQILAAVPADFGQALTRSVVNASKGRY